jgi:hypothetical protein
MCQTAEDVSSAGSHDDGQLMADRWGIHRMSDLSRMLKKSANGVLASLRGSTCRRESHGYRNHWRDFRFARINAAGERPTRSAVCTSSLLRSLRPCWTTFLSILHRVLKLS